MIKEIKFGGLSASPSDYEAPEGDLAAIIGAVPETGSISPVLPPRPVFMVDTGSTVAFVHETAYIRNYIIRDSSNHFTWRNESGDQSGDLDNDGQPLFSSSSTIHQVNAIGNTIVILSDSGMHYFLWKGSNDGYLYLGNHMPELDMSFGLQSYMASSGGGVLNLIDVWDERDNFPSLRGYDRDGNSSKKIATESIIPVINRFFSRDGLSYDRELFTKKTLFLSPFLVRYTYRLYDGTCVMHSVPVLMPCSLGSAPICFVRYFGDGTGDLYQKSNRLSYSVIGFAHELDYCISEYTIQQIQNWSDIIKSVDIFISQPLNSYNQNGEIEKFIDLDSKNFYSYGKLKNGMGTSGRFPGEYQRIDVWDAIKNELNNATLHTNFGFEIPQKEEKDFINEVLNCHTFYLLHSIDIKKLKSERTVISVDEGYLDSLTQKETIDDEYNSHDIVVPKFSYEYNSRLNLNGITRKLFKGYNATNSLIFTNYYLNINYTRYEPYLDKKFMSKIKIYYFAKQDNKDFILKTEEDTIARFTPILYLYHPNRNVYKALVVIQNISDPAGEVEDPTMYELPMVPHDMLNGAFFFEGLDFNIYDGKYEYTGDLPTVTPDSDNYVEERNKLYTSEVNNPFYFPVTGINTIGTGEIYSIRSAAKALSQGQFGQFPLYAFTSEGVWALEVNNTGAFSAKQPITRDVCINPDSITQLDDSVLFATDRGIMLLSGSSSTCISEILDYQQQFNITSLPHIDKLMQIAGVDPDALTYDSFHNFLLRCRMLYAYNLQRIIVYSTKADGSPYPYAYVYSLKSKLWGMMPSNITSSVLSYPEALAMTQYAKQQDCTYVAPTFILPIDSMYESLIELEVIKATDEDITFRVTTDVAAKIVVFDGKWATPGVYKGIALLSSGDTYTIKAGESKAFASTKGTIRERNSMYSIDYDENNVNRIYTSVTVTKGAYVEGNQLVDFSSIDPQSIGQSTRGMFITRPIKLDMPDVLKTVDTVIQRGNFRYGHVKSAIYGSRDLVNWIPIWTSTDHFLRGFRGNPYRYFRILSIFELDSTESIFGASVQYTPRFQNRLR